MEAIDLFDVYRAKWREAPFGARSRRSSIELANWDDQSLVRCWEEARRETCEGEGFSSRGWYHELYRGAFKGKRLLDVGSGFGFDAIAFAEAGAHVACLDIVESNLKVIERVARARRVPDIELRTLTDLDSIAALEGPFDVIWCQGSLINAPFDIVRDERRALVRHLPIGGRWIELVYPKSRWIREGKLPFTSWGERTDGPGTPWVEWYDLDKLLAALDPARFDVVLDREFHHGDFHWFDLVRRE